MKGDTLNLKADESKNYIIHSGIQIDFQAQMNTRANNGKYYPIQKNQDIFSASI